MVKVTRGNNPNNPKIALMVGLVLVVLATLQVYYWSDTSCNTLSTTSSLLSLTAEKPSSSSSSSTALRNGSGRTSDAGGDDQGWKTVAIFRGQPRTEPSARSNQADENSNNNNDPWSSYPWNGQGKQDQVVAALYHYQKQNGYFLDLASNDAIRMSNTYALEQAFSWTGLCVEPNPSYWSRLVNLRSCQVVGAVVGGSPSQTLQQRLERPIQFRFERAFGGIVGFDQKKEKEANTATDGKAPAQVKKPSVPEETMYLVPLSEILDRFGAPSRIDYLSLDVEGAEEIVLSEDFPFDQYTFAVLTVERPKRVLVERLRQHGYVFLKRLSKFGDLLFAHESELSQFTNWSILFGEDYEKQFQTAKRKYSKHQQPRVKGNHDSAWAWMDPDPKLLNWQRMQSGLQQYSEEGTAK